MFNLIIKDIAIQKREKTFWIVIFLSIANAFVFPKNPGFGILIPFISVYLIMVYSNAYDFKYKSEIMFNSMPVKKKNLVLAKYLSVFFVMGVSMLITFIINNILIVAGVYYISITAFVNTIFIEIFLISIYYSAFLPLYYKFGYIRSRWFNFIFMGLITAVFTIINDLKNGTAEADTPQSFQSLIVGLTGSGTLVQNSIMLLAAIILILISLMISTEIYIKKEF